MPPFDEPLVAGVEHAASVRTSAALAMTAPVAFRCAAVILTIFLLEWIVPCRVMLCRTGSNVGRCRRPGAPAGRYAVLPRIVNSGSMNFATVGE